MAKGLSSEDGIAAVYGGAILGGGGGGLLEEGLKLVEEIFAAGEPQMVDITELDQEDLVACVAMVGAPSAADQYISFGPPGGGSTPPPGATTGSAGTRSGCRRGTGTGPPR